MFAWRAALTIFLIAGACVERRPAAPTAAPAAASPPERAAASPAPVPATSAPAPAANDPTPSTLACDDKDRTTPRCRCSAGETAACLELSDDEFAAGDRDNALRRTIRLCDREVAAGCLRGAGYLEVSRIRERFGATAATLGARAVALLEAQCAAGSAETCAELARLLARGKYVAADRGRASQLAETACSAGAGDGCVFMAGLYERGDGVRKDRKRAVALLEKACDAGQVEACSPLADKLARTNPARSLLLHDKACAAGDPAACTRSGAIHARRGDHARAAERWDRACELDAYPSCVAVADLVERGKGVGRDPTRARELYERACDHGSTVGCVGFASMLATGSGGERNWAEGLQVLRDLCKRRIAGSCDKARRLARHAPDWRCRTAAECEAYCGQGIARSCRAQAELIAAAAIEDDCLTADGAYGSGCEYGDAASCAAGGATTSDREQAVYRYDRGCRFGDRTSCALADYLRLQDATTDERPTLVRSLERACTARPRSDACVLFAVTIRVTNERRAVTLLRGACARKSGAACRLMAAESGLGLSVGGTCCADGEPEQPDPAALERGLGFYRAGCEYGDQLSCDALTTRDSDRQSQWEARADEIERARRCAEYHPLDRYL